MHIAEAILLIIGASSLRDPDEFVNTSTLIRSKGYPAEEHDVTTQDGYILTVFRIPNPDKPVVFLQHGLLDASSSFVINFPEQSLGFVLWDAGYDVWIGNMRGNTYGKRHVKLTPKQDAFWDFSWSDMGKYDLPAMIDYSLETAGQKQLFYIGHSQGTLIMFSQLGTNERLASKVKLFMGMGPVSTVGHIKSPIKYLADIGATSNQRLWYAMFGKRDFLPSSLIIEWLADHICHHKSPDKLICENILFVLCGPSRYLNESRVAVYETHSPAGTSVKNLAHFSQMVISGRFQAYDYGSAKENMVHYNQSEPPLYDLSSIRTPVALYSATNDWLADPADVDSLRQALPNVVDYWNTDDWNHLDFIWGTNGKTFLYDRMIDLMQRYL